MTNKQPARLSNIVDTLRRKICKKSAIAVIRMNGIIRQRTHCKDGFNEETVDDIIERAFNKIPNCKAIALLVNSPGGSPVQSQAIAARIIALSQQKKIPVLTFAEDLAASGGYWILCAGDEIYANSSSIIGSIGVISAGFGFVDMMEKIGLERRIYTEGKNKSLLDPFTQEKQDDVLILKNAQKDVHESFVNFVKERRAGKLTHNEETLFDGSFWSGKQAKELGLVDNLVEDYKTFLKRRFGNEIKFVRINKPRGILSRTLGIEYFVESFIDKIQEMIARNKFGL